MFVWTIDDSAGLVLSTPGHQVVVVEGGEGPVVLGGHVATSFREPRGGSYVLEDSCVACSESLHR